AHKQSVTFLSVMDLVLQRWHWLFLGAACGAAGFYLLGAQYIRPKFTASAQLMRYEAPGKSESFKTAPISGDTFAALIRAPELLQSVGHQAQPPIPADLLAKSIKVDPDPDSDIVNIFLASRDARQSVDLLNLYITNAVEYTRTLEAKEAGVIANDYLKKQVDEMDRDLSYIEEQFRKLPAGRLLTNKLAAVGGQVNSLSTNLVVSQA